MTQALSAALAAIDQHATGDALLDNTAAALLVGYDNRWYDEHAATFATVAVELPFELPILNPDTNRASRTHRHAGKADALVRTLDGAELLLCEHKTTSEDIADPNATYWRRLSIDGQVSGYMLANWQEGLKLDGTLYDVIRKPGIRPRALTKAECALLRTEGTFFQRPALDADRELVADPRGEAPRETPTLFRLRLEYELAATPDRYFARRRVQRLDADLVEYAHELWEASDEIRLARGSGRHYRNPGACVQYGSPCEYLALCAGESDPDGPAWRHKPSVHSELPIVGDGRDVLTHSRLSAFRTCRRKHYYRYELGIERDREDRETLVFGSLVHEGLAAWFESFKV